MSRDEVLTWLNKRLSTFQQIDNDDMIFVTKVIAHYYPDTTTTMQDVVRSAQSIGMQRLSIYLDKMTNKLIKDFDVEIKIEPTIMGNFTGMKGELIQKYI